MLVGAVINGTIEAIRATRILFMVADMAECFFFATNVCAEFFFAVMLADGFQASQTLVDFVRYVHDIEESKRTLERELSKARQKNKEYENDILALMLDVDKLMRDNELLDAENTYREMEIEYLRSNGMADIAAVVDGHMENPLVGFCDSELERFQMTAHQVFNACQFQRHQNRVEAETNRALAEAEIQRQKDEELEQLRAKVAAIKMEEIRKCALCFDATVDTVTHPCRHMCMCYSCYDQLAKKPLAQNGAMVQCPMCRMKIQTVTRVFVS